MKIFAMIPARLSSKRIPKKNIRIMDGKPLIQYPIDLAIQAQLFDEIWVTTEAIELKPFVESLGAKFHMRPREYSTDSTTNKDFTYDFFKSHYCDYVVMINTTSPLLRPQSIISFIEMVRTCKYDTIVSVVSDQAESFYKDIPLNFSLDKKVNSQALEPIEKIVWALTAWGRTSFMERHEQGVEPIFGGNLGKFNIPKDESCDLDTMEDWEIAQGILVSRRLQLEEKFLKI